MQLMAAKMTKRGQADFLEALVAGDDGQLTAVVVKLDGKGAVTGREVPVKPEANWHEVAGKAADELVKPKAAAKGKESAAAGGTE